MTWKVYNTQEKEL